MLAPHIEKCHAEVEVIHSLLTNVGTKIRGTASDFGTDVGNEKFHIWKFIPENPGVNLRLNVGDVIKISLNHGTFTSSYIVKIGREVSPQNYEAS